MPKHEEPDHVASKRTTDENELVDLTGEDESQSTKPVDLTYSDGEDEDEDLKRAIALSLQDNPPSNGSVTTTTAAAAAAAPTCPPPEFSGTRPESRESQKMNVQTQMTTTGHGGLSGLDRKQMEAERLARLKRKRETTAETLGDRARSPPPPLPSRQRGPPSAAAQQSIQNISTRPKRPVAPTPPSVPSVPLASTRDTNWMVSSLSSLRYPTGNVFLTSLDKSREEAISLPEILRPARADMTLKSAFLSTFIVDFDWLLPHFDTRSVSFVLALHARSEQHQKSLRQDFSGIPNVRLVFPYVGGIVNCMHSKVMILFYESHPAPATAAQRHPQQQKEPRRYMCRIVVPSANLVPWDWGVKAVMENILFVIDLPSHEDDSGADGAGLERNTQATTTTATATRFKTSLVQQLRAMGTPDDVLRKLETFDWSSTAPYGFVHTIGGSHVLPPLSASPTATAENPTKTNDIHRSFAVKSGAATTQAVERDGSDDRSSDASTALASSRPDVANTGLLGLADTVRALGLDVSPITDESSSSSSRSVSSSPPSSHLPRIDYVTSSLGNLKQPFLRHLFTAVCGHAPDPRWFTMNKSRTKRVRESQHRDEGESSSTTTEPMMAAVNQNLKVYFPSDQTVQQSRGGAASAGTICFQSKWWEAASANEFPKSILHDCVGARHDGILMHSKILFTRFATPKSAGRVGSIGERKCQNHMGKHTGTAGRCDSSSTLVDPTVRLQHAGWVYIGSANLSESAWGSLVIDSKSKQPKLNCRNWETGVLIPVPLQPKHETVSLQDLTLQEVFGSVLPVPVEYPGLNLVEGRRRPWFFAD